LWWMLRLSIVKQNEQPGQWIASWSMILSMNVYIRNKFFPPSSCGHSLCHSMCSYNWHWLLHEIEHPLSVVSPLKWQCSHATHFPNDGLLVSILRPHSSTSIISDVATSALPKDNSTTKTCPFSVDLFASTFSHIVDDTFFCKSRRCSALTMLWGENGAIVGSIFNKNVQASAIVPSGCPIWYSANQTRCRQSTWRSAMWFPVAYFGRAWPEALHCLIYRRHVHTEGYWYCWVRKH
jgi:hypothetical protein